MTTATGVAHNMASFFDRSRYYFKPRVAIVFFLGIASGMPFLLLLSTLSVWLTEAGISKTNIGLMAWVTIPYTLKFLWAPFLARTRLPILANIFGHKRSWLLLVQSLLMIAIVGLGSCNPRLGLLVTACWAFAVGFLSSCQDVLIEGYRIDSLDDDYIGKGASASVIGYRVGMLIASAGALYLSSIASWQWVYCCMSSCILLGMVATLCSDEQKEAYQNTKKLNISYTESLGRTFIAPLQNILHRKDWWLILLFMLSFKASDTVFNTMNMPFLMEVGFSKLEIANVAKSFGILAMILGGLVGGALLSKYPLPRILLFCMWLQMVAGILFILQSHLGNDIRSLFLVMGVENFASGVSQVGLVYYLTLICRGPISAATFALLTSLGSLDRVVLSMSAGFLADNLPWVEFFAVAILFSLPAVWLLYARKESFMDIICANEEHGSIVQERLLTQSTKV